MIEHLNKETFKQKVFDYENTQSYEQDIPCILDFYADWCAPCKMVAPILEELDREYSGKINIYKINTEVEQELAGMFGIRSIPTFLICSKGKQLSMFSGALPKEVFKEVIDKAL